MFKMDYLVSDIVNSNIPECCLKSAAQGDVSRQPFVVCDTCRSGLDYRPVNGNSLSKFGTDLLTPDSTRLQWFPRVPDSLSRITSTEHPEGLVHPTSSRITPSVTSHSNTQSLEMYKDQNCSQDATIDRRSHLSCTSSYSTRLDYCYAPWDSHQTLDLTENNNKPMVSSNTCQVDPSSWTHKICGNLNPHVNAYDDTGSWSTDAKTNSGTLNPCGNAYDDSWSTDAKTNSGALNPCGNAYDDSWSTDAKTNSGTLNPCGNDYDDSWSTDAKTKSGTLNPCGNADGDSRKPYGSDQDDSWNIDAKTNCGSLNQYDSGQGDSWSTHAKTNCSSPNPYDSAHGDSWSTHGQTNGGSLSQYDSVQCDSWSSHGQTNGGSLSPYDSARGDSWSTHGQTNGGSLSPYDSARGDSWSTHGQTNGGSLSPYDSARGDSWSTHGQTNGGSLSPYDSARGDSWSTHGQTNGGSLSPYDSARGDSWSTHSQTNGGSLSPYDSARGDSWSTHSQTNGGSPNPYDSARGDSWSTHSQTNGGSLSPYDSARGDSWSTHSQTNGGSPNPYGTFKVDSWSTHSQTNGEQHTSQLSNLPYFSKLAHAAADEINIVSDSEHSPKRSNSCIKQSQELVPALSKLHPHEVSPLRDDSYCQQLPHNGNDDSHVFASQHKSSCRYTTTSKLLNGLTTVRSGSNSKNATSSHNHRGSFHLNSLSDQRVRHSRYHQKTTISRFLTPGLPIPSVLPEEFYDIHDLDHENEDLTAEVVFSLHFRNYQIREVLGKGISSTVRRVMEKATGIEYAVKIIDISGEKGELVQIEQVKKDTFREINILRMCAGHSNIIELHDVFETPTFIFLVFEICKKGELFDYLTSVVSLSEKRTRIFMRQLFEAVAFFHEKNIVHRDLKPENILLDDVLNIKVSDFGFATVVKPGEELSELCGTPGYLAPEVLAHSMYENVSGYSKEVDMWACGVIMYTLLCGAPPFWNRRQMMMLRAIMSADYTFNSPEWDDITEAPKNLIRNLLVVNPKDRLTAREALQHSFFQTQDDYDQYEQVYEHFRRMSSIIDTHMMLLEEKKFKALRKFKAGVHSVIFYQRINFYFKHPTPVSVQTVRDNPYGVKIMRKVIDTCAFGMYRHWVKRVDNQNRAALFEHTLRDDWKHTLMTLDGIRA